MGDRAADRAAVRIAGWPTWRTAWAQQRPAARDDARALERRLPRQRADAQRAVRAAQVRELGRSPLRSTSVAGRARRKFRSGTRLWPPASAFASSPSTRERGGDRVRRDVVERRRLHVRRRRSHAAPASPRRDARAARASTAARQRAGAARPGRRRAHAGSRPRTASASRRGARPRAAPLAAAGRRRRRDAARPPSIASPPRRRPAATRPRPSRSTPPQPPVRPRLRVQAPRDRRVVVVDVHEPPRVPAYAAPSALERRAPGRAPAPRPPSASPRARRSAGRSVGPVSRFTGPPPAARATASRP